MKTDIIETHEMRKGTTDLVSRDQLIDRINDYLNNEQSKTGNGDYYMRIIGSHLEIGRAKTLLEE